MDTSPEGNPANLANLPNEILTQIISYICVLKPRNPSCSPILAARGSRSASTSDRAVFKTLRLVCRSLHAAVTNEYTAAVYLPSYVNLFTNVASSGKLFANVEHGSMRWCVRYLAVAEKNAYGCGDVDAEDSLRALTKLGCLERLETMLFTCASNASRMSFASAPSSPIYESDAALTDDENSSDFEGSYINTVLSLAAPGLAKVKTLTRLWLCEWEPDAYPACETAHWHELLSHLVILKLDCNTSNDTPPLLYQEYNIKSRGKIHSFVEQFQQHWGPYLTSLKDFSLQTSPAPDPRFNGMFFFPVVKGSPLRTGRMEGLYFSNIVITRHLLGFIMSHKRLKRLRVDCCRLSTDKDDPEGRGLSWSEVFQLCASELKDLCYFRPLLKKSHFRHGEWNRTIGTHGEEVGPRHKMDHWWTLMDTVERNAVLERARYEELQRVLEKDGNYVNRRYGTSMQWDRTLEAYISYFEGSPDYFIFE